MIEWCTVIDRWLNKKDEEEAKNSARRRAGQRQGIPCRHVEDFQSELLLYRRIYS